MRHDYLSVPLSEIMTKKVVTVEMDDSLAVIRDIFQHVRFYNIMVVGNNKLFGVISDRDIFKEMSPFLGTFSEDPRDRHYLNKKAHQIMRRELVTVPKETTIKAASNLLINHNVNCLPITDKEGRIEGIVTWKDILYFLVEHGGIKEA